MLTFEQAKQLKPGDILYSLQASNAKGERQRWRVNGKVRTWKKSPARIYIPLKHGLYDYDSICEHDFQNGICALVSLYENLF